MFRLRFNLMLSLLPKISYCDNDKEYDPLFIKKMHDDFHTVREIDYYYYYYYKKKTIPYKNTEMTVYNKNVQLAAVKKNGNSIKYILNPDKEVQLAAVNENGICIQYILNPNKEVQLAAVKENGICIKYILNPDKEVQLAAVKEN